MATSLVTQFPSISDWATYGIYPGVLVGVIVILGAANAWLIVSSIKWLLEWHTKELAEMRAAHAAERASLLDKLDELTRSRLR